MQAIVSELDDPHRELVENVWGELKAIFALPRVTGATQPHLTYAAAEQYDPARIDTALRAIAAGESRFAVRTEGVGIFARRPPDRGEETVLYLAVHRGPELMRLHGRISGALAPITTSATAVYAAATWIPHVTLGIGEITEAQLPDVVRFLGSRETRWEIPVTNVSLIPDTTSTATSWRRFDFAVRSSPPPSP